MSTVIPFRITFNMFSAFGYSTIALFRIEKSQNVSVAADRDEKIVRANNHFAPMALE